MHVATCSLATSAFHPHASQAGMMRLQHSRRDALLVGLADHHEGRHERPNTGFV